MEMMTWLWVIADGTLNYLEKGSGGFNWKTGDDNPFDGIDPGSHSAPAIDNNNNLFVGYKDTQNRLTNCLL